MKVKAKIDGIHEGNPMVVDIEVEFDKGEYIEVLKTMPSLIGQVKSMIEQDKHMKRARKAMRRNARNANKGAQNV